MSYLDWLNTLIFGGGSGGGGAVNSVNGKTGTVVLDASDVSALPNTLTIITTTAIKVPQMQIRADADNMQAIALEITCNDTYTYTCTGWCHAELENDAMLVTVHLLSGHAYKRAFGAQTGTLREILPLLTLPLSTVVEYFTVPCTQISGDVYEIEGTATFKSQSIRGAYAFRESVVSLTT